MIFVFFFLFFIGFYLAFVATPFTFIYFIVLSLVAYFFKKNYEKQVYHLYVISIIIVACLSFLYTLYIFLSIINPSQKYSKYILENKNWSGEVIQVKPHNLLLKIYLPVVDGSGFTFIKPFFKARGYLEEPLDSVYIRDKINFRCNFSAKTDIKGLWDIIYYLQAIYFTCNIENYDHISQEKNFFNVLRLRIATFLNSRLSLLDQESLAPAILLADTSLLSYKGLQLFRHMGIAHLFSASGLHLGLIFMFVMLPFRYCRMDLLGRLLALLVCTIFLFLLDFRLSLLRAYCFMLLYTLLPYLGRNKVTSIVVLFFSACCCEILFPLSSFTVSFILSFGVTFFIILFYKPLDEVLVELPNWLRGHLVVSLACWFAGTLLGALFFNYTNLLSILYNFVLTPLTILYIPSIFIFLLFAISFPIVYLDKIYYFFAFLHNTIWEQFFPTIYTAHLLIYTAWVTIMSFVILYVYYTDYTLYIRKYLTLFIFSTLAIYFTPFIAYPSIPTQYHYFPYGVVYYRNSNLYVYGKFADFFSFNSLENKETHQNSKAIYKKNKNLKSLLNLYSVQDWPIRQLYASEDIYHHIKNFFTLPQSTDKTLIKFSDHLEITSGLLKLNNLCMIWLSKIEIDNWSNNVLEECSQIDIIISRKETINIQDWLLFFKSFGFLDKYNSKVYLRYYYQKYYG